MTTAPLSNDARAIEELRSKLGGRLTIVGHHYEQEATIQHCDIRGDSLELARRVPGIASDYIVFCGVYFMAESAALLAREGQQVRERALQYGVSQISGGSRTSVGGYNEPERPHDTEQFDVSDQRTLDEVISWLMDNNHIPSFCTACYRAGRTGDRFMSFCKNGEILNYCHPNALMTLTEYLADYATPETKEKGLAMVKRELLNIPNEKTRRIAEQHVGEILAGTGNDFRF